MVHPGFLKGVAVTKVTKGGRELASSSRRLGWLQTSYQD
jgi:hypothetical protein